MALSLVEPAVLAAIDALQIAYLDALDRRDMQAWLACFAEDGAYACLSAEGEEQGLPVAIMLDDSHARLRDRVKFVTEVWAGTYEDYRTRHFVQRLRCTPGAPSLYAVTSSFLVVYTTARGQSEVLAAGRYEDQVRVTSAGAAFKEKRAIIDTDVTPRYLVYPL
jgi:3-phenylpropionate/cinnamic acid dioxygenase small subunit